MANIRALVFDVFGTVVDWRGGVAREAGKFLKRHAADALDPGVFADAWRARYQPAMEEVRSGRRPFTRLDVLHRENLEAILPEMGIDLEDVAEDVSIGIETGPPIGSQKGPLPLVASGQRA